jgi:DUF1365 family protein
MRSSWPATATRRLALLRDADPIERDVLGAIRYQTNEAVLHTDASLLPRNRKAWAAWNAHVPRDPAAPCTVSYCMNLLQGLPGNTPLVVTLNRSEAIDPGKVLRTLRYAHPVHDHAAVRAQQRWAELQGRRHTWFAGAYWGWGFHEDGIRSARRVVDALRTCEPHRSWRLPARWPHERQRALLRAGDAPQAPSTPACVPLPHRAAAARSGRAGHGVRRPLAVVGQSPQPGRVPSQRLLRRSRAPLADAVRDHAAATLGYRPAGPVRLLTHLRFAGHVFNPVSFYYCYRADGSTLDCIVAEITNTPWKERHAYVLVATATHEGTSLRWQFDKCFHVSPFMPMDCHYDWRFNCPDEDCACTCRSGATARASLMPPRSCSGTLDGRGLARVLACYPLMTTQVVAAIHWQALRLWLKRNPVHDHPTLAEKPR